MKRELNPPIIQPDEDQANQANEEVRQAATHAFNNSHTSPTNKMDYLKRIKYVVNNGGGYARQAESARARRAHQPD